MHLTRPRWASSTLAPARPKRGPKPVAKVDAALGYFNPSSRRDRKRRDVINPELCRQAIKLVKDGLPAPGKCDIIDINPGTGVWSQALHHTLKPRRHVVVELDTDRYGHALDPLLKAKNSHYRHTARIADVFDLTTNLLSRAFRKSHDALSPAEKAARRQQPTDQLLITANLCTRSVEAEGFKGPLSKLFLEQFRKSIAIGPGFLDFHQWGLAKLLAWVPVEHKSSFLPDSALRRSRMSTLLEACCHVREIAGAPRQTLHHAQSPYYSAAVASATMTAERRSVSTPPSRRSPPPEPPFAVFDATQENVDELEALTTQVPLVKNYIKTYKRAQRECPQDLYKVYREQSLGIKAGVANPLLKELRILRRKILIAHNHYFKVESLLEEQLALEQELIDLRQAHPDDFARYETVLEVSKPKFADIHARYATMFKDDRHAYLKGLDEHRMLMQHPPVLAWNNRDFEPLRTHPPTDFSPPDNICLLEFTPKADFYTTFNTGSRVIVFDFIVQTAFATRTVQAFLQALLQVDADTDVYQEFVKTVPSLTDPLLGGRWDYNEMRSRILSLRQLTDVALAYERWPHRMDDHAMMSRMDFRSSPRLGTKY